MIDEIVLVKSDGFTLSGTGEQLPQWNIFGTNYFINEPMKFFIDKMNEIIKAQNAVSNLPK